MAIIATMRKPTCRFDRLRAIGFRLLFGVFFTASAAHAEWITETQSIMGTRCAVELWSDDKARGEAAIAEEPNLPLTSGYIQRAKNLLPKQGTRKPWRMNQNYALDVMALRFGAIEDGAIEFRRRGPTRDAA